MDTDDLSRETYKAVIIEAEKFSDDLTLQFGVLSYRCSNEEDYLLAVKNLIKTWKKNMRLAIDDIFYNDDPPSRSAFQEAILKIESNIQEVEKIPFKNRKFDY